MPGRAGRPASSCDPPAPAWDWSREAGLCAQRSREESPVNHSALPPSGCRGPWRYARQCTGRPRFTDCQPLLSPAHQSARSTLRDPCTPSPWRPPKRAPAAMIFVLAVCVLAPCSMVYLLGAGAAALLPAVALVLGVTLGLGVRPGVLSLADDICSAWWWVGGGACCSGRQGGAWSPQTVDGCLPAKLTTQTVDGCMARHSPSVPSQRSALRPAPPRSHADGVPGGGLLWPAALHDVLGQG